MVGELLTQWTIRLALALYVVWLAGWLSTRGPRWLGVARWLWTAGCGLLFLHVACAFHFSHSWSHAAAWKDTADQTKALMGVAFGDGIYFSYAFMGLWLLDVIWMWWASAAHRTPWPRVLVHCFLFFIAFNGAIVFETGPVRWAGIAASLLLAGLALRWTYNSWRKQQTLLARDRVSLTPDS